LGLDAVAKVIKSDGRCSRPRTQFNRLLQSMSHRLTRAPYKPILSRNRPAVAGRLRDAEMHAFSHTLSQHSALRPTVPSFLDTPSIISSIGTVFVERMVGPDSPMQLRFPMLVSR
jgi:hypothetical protein